MWESDVCSPDDAPMAYSYLHKYKPWLDSRNQNKNNDCQYFEQKPLSKSFWSRVKGIFTCG